LLKNKFLRKKTTIIDKKSAKKVLKKPCKKSYSHSYSHIFALSSMTGWDFE